MEAPISPSHHLEARASGELPKQECLHSTLRGGRKKLLLCEVTEIVCSDERLLFQFYITL